MTVPTAPVPRTPEDSPDSHDGPEFEQLFVWPDEIRIGDYYGGYVVTAVAKADHYRDPAVRLTVFTDPEELEQSSSSEEWGRFVLRTDRGPKGHKVPIDRIVR